MLDSFFSKEEVQSSSSPDGKIYSCITCGLLNKCKSPNMAPYGNFKKEIMVIGEAPGEHEDNADKPWQGPAGRVLQRKLRELGIDLFNDCMSINAISCRPTDDKGYNRTPSAFELNSCRRFVIGAIKKYKPKLILVLGESALFSLIEYRWQRTLSGISRWRGFQIPDQDFKAWICPTFHPSYIMRSEDGPEDKVWTLDLSKALEKLSVSFPVYKEPHIEIVPDPFILTNIHTGYVSIDYETTGIKPHAPGHRILCASVAVSEDHAYVFMMPPSPAGRKPFTDLLANPAIQKFAHNMKFEDAWSRVRLKTRVKNWSWDSMLAAHILDNRPGITGLKFQTYIHMGVIDYDSDITPYISSEDDNANGFNRLSKLIEMPGGPEKLMKYCGLDAVHEYRIAKWQRSLIHEHCLPF